MRWQKESPGSAFRAWEGLQRPLSAQLVSLVAKQRIHWQHQRYLCSLRSLDAMDYARMTGVMLIDPSPTSTSPRFLSFHPLLCSASSLLLSSYSALVSAHS